MATSHSVAAARYEAEIEEFIARASDYSDLPREMFSYIAADSQLRKDINLCVMEEMHAITSAYDALAIEDEADMKRLESGEMTEDVYDKRDRLREDRAGEISRRDVSFKEATFTRLEEALPGVLSEETFKYIHPDQEKMRDEFTAADEVGLYEARASDRAHDAFFTPENYFALADDAQYLAAVTDEMHKDRGAVEYAQIDQDVYASRMAPLWYGMSACGNYKAEPYSEETIEKNKREIIDLVEREGFAGLMEHIDRDMFYRMSFPQQLDVVSERFERGEAVNEGLVSYCVNASMTQYAELEDLCGDDYTYQSNRDQFVADIDAAKAFHDKYPEFGEVTDKTIADMKMAYKTDGRSVGYIPQRYREEIEEPLISSDGFNTGDYENHFGE